MPKHLTIGTLAREAGCAVETIRYYEAEGLLPAPQRTAANYRVYGPAHLQRLALILQCRALDMTLDEIRELLQLADRPDSSCAGIDQLLDQHLEHVSARLHALQALEVRLQQLRSACNRKQSADNCGILEALRTPAAGDAPATENHAHPAGVHGRAPRRKTAAR